MQLQTSELRGAVRCSRRQIYDVDVLPAQQLLCRASWDKREPAAHVLCEAYWHSARRDGAEPFTLISHKCAASGTAESVGLFEDRVEYRREVAGRGIDDLQYLGCGGLLLQCLARLGQEPRILHRNDRLRGEVLQQRDLLVGKWPYLKSARDNHSKQCVTLPQGYRQ